VLNGANTALLGDEVIQFTTATLIEPGKYRLAGLLRGRLGTEWAISAHQAGERFVLIDGRLQKEAIAQDFFGISRLYKGVTIGQVMSDVAERAFAYEARSLKPYAPAHVVQSVEANADITIEWVRRTRIGGAWLNGVDAALGESEESYEIDILDGGVVVRTLSTSTSSLTYSEADQITDFGSAQSSVAGVIYQISAVVGRGYGALI
jgi:hypothetical protein